MNFLHTSGSILLVVFLLMSASQAMAQQEREITDENILFSKGEKIENNNFNGAAWVSFLVRGDSTNQTSVGNVTFEPGARTNWHSHPAGQILLVTGGIGYYQEKGGPKKILHKGDVVKCPPNIPHWHGASPDQEFVQIAITSREKGPTKWLNPVTNEEYRR